MTGHPIAQTFPDYDRVEDALNERLSESLAPRGPETLFDYVTALGLPAGASAIDVGCADGEEAVALHLRFGFNVLGIDPDEPSVLVARMAAEAAGCVDAVAFERGRSGLLPALDATVDLVWCRDVVELVADLDETFSEISRVLKPDGHAVLYTMCSTERLKPYDEDRVLKKLGCHPASMNPERLRESIVGAGLTVDVCDVLGSEWGEYAQERSGKPGERLLRAARLLRRPKLYIDEFGLANYETALADCLWHVYRMTGELSSHAYVLSRS